MNLVRIRSGKPGRAERGQHRVLVAGQDLPREQLAGDQAERCPRMGEGHEAAWDLPQFAEHRFAVARDRLVADLPARRLELGVAGNELDASSASSWTTSSAMLKDPSLCSVMCSSYQSWSRAKVLPGLGRTAARGVFITP